MTTSLEFTGILVAALGGLAIGIERQWSGHASGRRARLGGIRTFTLLGAIGGLAGSFSASHPGFAVVMAAGATALVVAGYVSASRREIDATTEAAALVVIAAGIAAGFGAFTLASGIVAVCVVLLLEKSRLHQLVREIDDEELRAAARFGVMAVVILPLLPEGPFGPWGGIRPRELWMLVLFFTGLDGVGYLARRLLGTAHGYPMAGLLGGMVSSTNVTFSFARLSRREPGLSRTLAAGSVAACTMLFPRVLVATTVLNASVARALLPHLVLPFAIGGLALLLWFRTADLKAPTRRLSNPLHIVPALQMTMLFQVVLFAMRGLRQWLGGGGILLAGAVLGLTDVDALTLSMSKLAVDSDAVRVAAHAIAIGIIANCVLKAAIAASAGTRQFSAGAWKAIAAMAIGIVASVVLFD